MPQSYIKRILDARVYDIARETPIDEAMLMSRRLDNRVWLKREDLQPVFSFKLRGAYNKMSRLRPEQLAAGVVAASAGNHAQGVAMAAQKLNVKATIVMPRTTPQIKVDAVRNRGARVVLHGDSFDEASVFARKLVEEKAMTYVHPFDDPDVIAGQGTIGMEIIRQHQQPLDALFVPVGGGGLLAGVAAYVRYVWPQTRIIGVEPEDAACLQLALQKRRRATLPEVGLFADGCAVAQIGKETFRVIRSTVDEVITISTDEMCVAIKDIFEDISRYLIAGLVEMGLPAATEFLDPIVPQYLDDLVSWAAIGARPTPARKCAMVRTCRPACPLFRFTEAGRSPRRRTWRGSM